MRRRSGGEGSREHESLRCVPAVRSLVATRHKTVGGWVPVQTQVHGEQQTQVHEEHHCCTATMSLTRIRSQNLPLIATARGRVPVQIHSRKLSRIAVRVRLDGKSLLLHDGPGNRGVVDTVDIEGWRADATDVWPAFLDSDVVAPPVLRLKGPLVASCPADDDHEVARLRKDWEGDRPSAVRSVLVTHGEAAVILEDML